MSPPPLTERLARIERESGCELGIHVLDLKTGEETALNADAIYPMASTFKVPILVTAFQQIAAGRLRLDDRRSLLDGDKSRGSGILPFFEAGLNPSLQDLLTLMIIISDNTATDMVIELLGGPAAIESAMHALSVEPLSFRYNCRDLIRRLFPPGDHSDEELTELAREMPYPADSLPAARDETNNTASPRAMTTLLHKMFAQEATDAAGWDAMVEILLQQQLKQRLGRYLPPEVQVATKTGTILSTANDCGFFFLPNGAQIALTCYALWDAAPAWNDARATWAGMHHVESTIGEVGWAVCEHYG
ncbi:MAG: class A beta-lactamase-related serine hydrolase [Chloroflexi bacterium]|nr:class A beta-lactamase-related serine hydrolase [Chloroflexota bacterium]